MYIYSRETNLPRIWTLEDSHTRSSRLLNSKVKPLPLAYRDKKLQPRRPRRPRQPANLPLLILSSAKYHLPYLPQPTTRQPNHRTTL